VKILDQSGKQIIGLVKLGKFNNNIMISLIGLLFENSDEQINCKCGWSWKKSEGGKDPYICHHCGLNNKELHEKKKKNSLWGNINAKHKRGEKPSHGNSNAFKKAFKAAKDINKGK